MSKLPNSNWRVAVTLVISAFLTVCGWLIVEGYSSVIRRLDVIEEQTRELPALRTRIEFNQDAIKKNVQDIEDLRTIKVDKD